MPRPTFRFLPGEGKRNRENAQLYITLLQRAWGDAGSCQVMVGHHIAYLFDGDLSTQDEVPAADTVLFDHDIMGAVFGEHALALMQALVPLRRYEREAAVMAALQALDA